MLNRHAAPAAGAISLDSLESETPPHVLVVDDSKEVRDLIVWLLHNRGYRALAAENGFAAQLLLTAMHPILIICDLVMPLGDGWELLTFCHTHHPEIPVLLVSGERLGRQPEVESWAAGFVPKPFDPQKFHSAVDLLLSRAAPLTALSTN